MEKETVGLVLALDHFDVYLDSTPFKIKVYTDHNPLTFLKTMKNKNQRLVRWSLALQEYKLEGLKMWWQMLYLDVSDKTC